MPARMLLGASSGCYSDCGQGKLAREAQQQAQREERLGKEDAERLGLVHETDYNGSHGI